MAAEPDMDEVLRFLKKQISTWQASAKQLAHLDADLLQCDASIVDAIDRCCVAGGSGDTEIASNQEAIIRTRVARRNSLGDLAPKVKDRKERQAELVELRHELACIADDDPDLDISGFAEIAKASPQMRGSPTPLEPTPPEVSPTAGRHGRRRSFTKTAPYATPTAVDVS